MKKSNRPEIIIQNDVKPVTDYENVILSNTEISKQINRGELPNLNKALDKVISDYIKINLSKCDDENSTIKYDEEKKRLTIDTSKQKKYTVYLYQLGKENKIYPEIMTEMELVDLKHRIMYGLTDMRIQDEELFIEE